MLLQWRSGLLLKQFFLFLNKINKFCVCLFSPFVRTLCNKATKWSFFENAKKYMVNLHGSPALRVQVRRERNLFYQVCCSLENLGTAGYKRILIHKLPLQKCIREAVITNESTYLRNRWGEVYFLFCCCFLVFVFLFSLVYFQRESKIIQGFVIVRIIKLFTRIFLTA